MGSEHYCLRWNNHQSNLLGVFSQLLHDESLVDVTLACAEGPSIRAHKVVLSACSSYFQSLFLEHPATHPIVILKDVRFSELKNLVDFMYKGEVNIQYCQLPTLLKTAESLKVKGLAEMTNQNSTQRETEHEQDRIRPVPTPKSSDHLDYQSTLKHEYDDPDRCLSSSPVHMQSSSPTPLALYKRRSPRDTNETASIHGSSSKKIHLSSNIITNDDQQDPSNENPNDREINPESSEALNSMGLSGGHQSCLPPPSPMSTVDLKSMQGCTILTTTATFTSAGASTTTVAGSSMSSNAIVPSDNRLSSPMLTPEPVAGPSGLGPVQSVPLSLKKEIDWDRSDDKSISECSNDYRHQHDSYNMRLPPSKMLGRHTMFNRTNPYAPCHSMNRLSPYPYGLSLFDADPSKLLTVFQQQSLLAEEAFRMRGILFPTSEAIRYNILDLINKESESKSQAIQQRSSSTIISSEKYTSSDHGSSASSSVSKQRNPNIQNSPTSSSSPQCSKDNAKTETTSTDGRTNLTHESTDTSSSNRSSFVDELLMLHKRNTEGIRDNLASFACDSELGGPDQCSTPSGSSSSPSLSTKSLSESMLFQEPIEEETKCVVCNANFPSVWLLEQHASLQHAGVNDEKPFICEQCGQSYRYRSAYAKHREQNHRARLPADKLFTCDVCGMQFRYLKSFKKHRLNHALERIHGKVEKKYQTKVIDSSNNDVVTSSNEMLSNRLDNNIGGDESKDTTTTTGAQEGDEDQDATIDSASTTMKTDQLIDGEQERANDEMQVNLLAISSQSSEVNRFEQPDAINYSHFLQQNQRTSPLPTTSLSALISAKAMTSDQILGLNPQEASLLNFFRVDAAERQRERTKQNNNRFACPFCGKCVRSKENLKLHVRKHTGERPFVCLFCGRAFGGKSDLTRHLRIHTGERPYHCESCGKCFARADYLSKHLTTHVHNSPR